MLPGDDTTQWSTIDRVYAALRVAALLAGLAYVYLGGASAALRANLMAAFGVFALYGLALYAVGQRWLGAKQYKPRFYAAAAVLDLIFVLVLMNLTGGGASPFYRALYLWVAMPAMYFGMRTGSIASAVALFVLAWFFDFGKLDTWDTLVRAGGLLLHGPFIGFLVDRDRAQQQRVRELEAQVDKLDYVSRWLVTTPQPVEPDADQPNRSRAT